MLFFLSKHKWDRYTNMTRRMLSLQRCVSFRARSSCFTRNLILCKRPQGGHARTVLLHNCLNLSAVAYCMKHN